jgi:hypothetical protein
MDLLKCLLDSEALETHVAVERWTLDERALVRRLFKEVLGPRQAKEAATDKPDLLLPPHLDTYVEKLFFHRR